jgi:ceramide glucosyltransferase
MLQLEFPAVPSRVIFVADVPEANPKMVKLREMVEQARHEVLVISDADISVEAGYLRQVVAPLNEDKVGLVTCLYRGVPARGLNSLFEALSMAGDFVGQVLLGRMLGGMRFGLGATMATRKKQIRAIGGLTPWLQYLADDFILGNKVAASGRLVHLSKIVVTTCLTKRSWRASFQQQLRWARTIRACSPGGYPGLIFAYGLPISLMLLLAGEASPWKWVALATVVTRFLAAWASGVGVARDPLIRKYFWLLPLRDIWALMIWVYSFLGSQIVWRSRRYRLDAGGKLSRLSG